MGLLPLPTRVLVMLRTRSSNSEWDHVGMQPVLCTLSGGWAGGPLAGPANRVLVQGLLRSF